MARLAYGFPCLVALFAGCNSTGVGNPTSSVSFAITADPAPEPDAEDPEAELAEGQLTRAVLVLDHLRWIACDPADADVVAQGPFVVDLIENQISPAVDRISVPESGFCGLKAPLRPADKPAALAGRSVLFTGSRPDGARFVLYASIEGTLHLVPRTAEPWLPEANSHWLWTLRPRRWLVPSELDATETDPADPAARIIPIDANRHPLLLESIRARIARRSSLHEDINGNGQVDVDERTGPAWLGSGLSNLE